MTKKKTEETKNVKKVETKTASKPSIDFKKLALTLATVKLPSRDRLWIEVTPEWIKTAKEVLKSK